MNFIEKLFIYVRIMFEGEEVTENPRCSNLNCFLCNQCFKTTFKNIDVYTEPFR